MNVTNTAPPKDSAYTAEVVAPEEESAGQRREMFRGVFCQRLIAKAKTFPEIVG
jgi:hypothetical protein